MFFKDDFNHLSPNANDNFFILNEKLQKYLRGGTKQQIEDRLAKKKARLDKVEAEKEKLVKLSYPQKVDPNDPVVGAAGFNLIGVAEQEKGHLRDIKRLKAKLAEQMLPKEDKNTLDLDFQEKQKKKDEQKENKVERLIQKIDDDADQTHL
jgi:hypothetical protein